MRAHTCRDRHGGRRAPAATRTRLVLRVALRGARARERNDGATAAGARPATAAPGRRGGSGRRRRCVVVVVHAGRDGRVESRRRGDGRRGPERDGAGHVSGLQERAVERGLLRRRGRHDNWQVRGLRGRCGWGEWACITGRRTARVSRQVVTPFSGRPRRRSPELWTRTRHLAACGLPKRDPPASARVRERAHQCSPAHCCHPRRRSHSC